MNWTELVTLDGHAPYVVGSIAVCLAVMAAEVAALRSRVRAARRAMGEAMPFAERGAA
jgi:hypothetical protein